jgi:sugar lactone lactonase YvrE
MRIPLATGGDGVTYVPDTDIDNPFCLDFDADENLYVGTADGGFWRRNSDGSVIQILSDQGWGSPTRLNQGYVYWYTKSDSGNNGLYRAPLPDASTQDTIATSSIETILKTEAYTPSGLAVDSFGNVYLMDGWGATMLVRVTPSGTVEELIDLPTENPNKATFHGDTIVITQGNQGNQIWTYYLGEGYGDTATPRYRW